MESLALTLLIVLGVVTFAPPISRKLGIPVIVLEIVFGIFLGESLLNIIPESDTIEFLSSLGLIYLMFLAGIEADFKRVKEYLPKTISISFFSLAIPFLGGVILAEYAGIHPVLMGTILSTTSLGIVLPLTKELDYKEDFLSILLASAVVVDILSIFLLAFSLTLLQGAFQISFIYSVILVLLLFVIPWVINRSGTQKKIEKWVEKKSHFDMEVRFSFALIFVFAVISEHLGFHSIIGAFLAGLIIAELTPKSSLLEKKLESFGYGFFIPLFFIFVGARVDLGALFQDLSSIGLLLAILGVGILGTVIGVLFVSRVVGFSWKEGLAMGFFHATPLSLTIAAVEIVSRLGFIGENLFSSFVFLAVASAIVGPAFGKYILLHKH